MPAAISRRLFRLQSHLLQQQQHVGVAKCSSAVAEKIRVEPLPGLTFGCRILNCDVDKDLDDPEAFAKVWQAWLDYGLLVIPPQMNPDGSLLTEQQQLKFATRFGEIDHHLVLTNIKKNGKLLQDKKGDPGLVLHSTEGWHSDATFMPLAMSAGMIYAEIMPETGGETEICDMEAAYDMLDDTMKEKIAGLTAFHSLEAANVRRSGTHPNGRAANMPGSSKGVNAFESKAYLRSLVRVHPITGRKSLLTPTHAFGIPGMDHADSTKLMDDLIDAACQHPRVWSHKWQVGEILFYDQRRCFHRSMPYDGPRRIRSIRLKGDPQSSDAPLPDPTEGTEAYKAYTQWLDSEKAWEKPGHASLRGGFGNPGGFGGVTES